MSSPNRLTCSCTAENSGLQPAQRLPCQRRGGAAHGAIAGADVPVDAVRTVPGRAVIFRRRHGDRVRRKLGGADHQQVLGKRVFYDRLV